MQRYCIDIGRDRDQCKLWDDLNVKIKSILLDKFQKCFEKMIPRVKNKMSEWNDNHKTLLLLAGDGARLVGFDNYVEEALNNALSELNFSLGHIEKTIVPEPKRCVALGGFLTYFQGGGGIFQIRNDVPEDILLSIDPQLKPSDLSRVVDIKGRDKYYLLFKAGEQLDENHNATICMPLSEIGQDIHRGKLTFHLHTCLPGDEPYYYATLECDVQSDKRKLLGQLYFEYSAEGGKITVELK